MFILSFQKYIISKTHSWDTLSGRKKLPEIRLSARFTISSLSIFLKVLWGMRLNKLFDKSSTFKTVRFLKESSEIDCKEQLESFSSIVLLGIPVGMYPWTWHLTTTRVLPKLVHWQIFWLQTSLSQGVTIHKTNITCIRPINITTESIVIWMFFTGKWVNNGLLWIAKRCYQLDV